MQVLLIRLPSIKFRQLAQHHRMRNKKYVIKYQCTGKQIPLCGISLHIHFLYLSSQIKEWFIRLMSTKYASKQHMVAALKVEAIFLPANHQLHFWSVSRYSLAGWTVFSHSQQVWLCHRVKMPSTGVFWTTASLHTEHTAKHNILFLACLRIPYNV